MQMREAADQAAASRGSQAVRLTASFAVLDGQLQFFSPLLTVLLDELHLPLFEFDHLFLDGLHKAILRREGCLDVFHRALSLIAPSSLVVEWRELQKVRDGQITEITGTRPPHFSRRASIWQ